MRLPRMFHWQDWHNYVYPMLGKTIPSELFSYSKEEADGKVAMDPFKRPSHIAVPGKIKRTSSFSSLHSGMSADDVQKQLDMLQQSDTPLNAEDIATIVSGSLSLVGGDNSSDEESIYEGRMLQKQRDSAEGGTNVMQGEGVGGENMKKPPAAATTAIAQKKKALHDKLQERSEQYKKSKELTEKKMALESDATDVEGLQLFRSSYDLWKRISGAKSNNNTPAPSAEYNLSQKAHPFITK